MADEWRDVRLEDVAEVLLGKMLDQKKNRGAYLPYLANTNVRWGEFELADLRVMRFEAHESDRYGLRYGDIVMCEGGEPGRCALWRDEKKGMMYQKALHRIRPYEGTDNRFLYYSLLHGGRTGAFSPFCTGTTIKHLPRQNLLQVQLKVPPIAEQRAIAQVLGTLDDKIECNRRLNRTLEGIVRALFKSWFIDFDPVIDNALAAGNPIPDELADRAAFRQQAAEEYAKPLPDDLRTLFPAAFTHTDTMGWIPRGWGIRALDQVADYMNGLACQKYPVQDGEHGLPVIKIRELRSGISEQTDRAAASVPEKYLVRDGDILFSWSGSLFVRPWTEGPGVLNQHLFKVTSGAFPKWFIYLWTDHHLRDFVQIAADKATTMGHIKRDHLTAAKVVVPSGDVLGAADRQLGPALEKAISVLLQAQALTKLRDTLLPKLLTGEIKFPDTKQKCEETSQ